MNSDSTLSSRFSWQRVAMVARYYYPTLKIQILLYPLITLIAGVTSFMLMYTSVGMILASIIGVVTSAMVSFGPIIFIRRSNRTVETMLPATALEKATFIIPYCIILIPLLVNGLGWAVQLSLQSIFGEPTYQAMLNTTINMLDMKGSAYGLVSYLQAIVPTSTCMYAVFALRRNRAMAIVWTIASLVGLAIIGAVWGILLALNEFDVLTSNDVTDVQYITESLQNLMIILGTVSAVYAIAMSWLTARKISRIQL